jgi:hypothetical protein
VTTSCVFTIFMRSESIPIYKGRQIAVTCNSTQFCSTYDGPVQASKTGKVGLNVSCTVTIANEVSK